MKISIYVFAFATILFTACDSNTKKDHEQSNDHTEMNHKEDNHAHDHDDANSHPITTVLDTYLELKNALVEDNDEGAASAGKKLTEALNNMDNSSVSEEKMKELKDIIESAYEQAEHVSDNEGNIDHQREHLEVLSKDIKDLIALIGTDRTLYQEFCPMYQNNGGMWLSDSDEIKNPYFGSKMLNCGSVENKIADK